MAKGKIISTAQSGRKPVIITVKTIKIEAIEFLEAKKPCVVEIRPVIARAREARPIIGDKKMDPTLPPQEKNGKNPFLMFSKYASHEKLSMKKIARMVSGYLIISKPTMPM